ncbi:MAG: PKD domain-containing protein [Ferruginibacter sp.]
MKNVLLLLFFLSSFSLAYAKHITGGEMIYDYLGPGSTANTKRYLVTLRLFRDENCFGCSVMPATVTMGIYNNDNNNRIGYITRSLQFSELVPINALPPCITNPPTLSYTVGYYEMEIELTNNNSGYTIAYQTCCRIDNIMNVPNSVGATYTCNIPGPNDNGSINDSSPRFSTGISVVCYNKPFTLNFSATDPDSDSLVYSLCSAKNGGDAADASFNTPGPPPYGVVTYINGFSGTRPLGILANIDPRTGIISGVAPDAGKYVVSVCISSYRNGQFISIHNKDFIISVDPCDFAGSQLEPSYISCDGFSFTFFNLNNSPLNQTFYWDFGDGLTSTAQSPLHTYTTAGIYTLKLVVNRGLPCSDSTTSPLKVFPGYFPNFSAPSPICKDKPVQFTDLTTANYGAANEWHWNFDVDGTAADTSRIKNPVYTYPVAGTYDVTLIVASDKGCRDTITKQVVIVDKPEFSVSNDTLICNIDTLKLNAVAGSAGAVTWSPNYNINSLNSFTPLVSPDVTTTYYVSFIDNSGCATSDSVKVNVVDHVTLEAGRDTTICRTDAVRLMPSSDGLQYEWTPAATLNDPLIKDPIATPISEFTTYHVTAHIGKCFADDELTIHTVPYPAANAGKDTSICIGQSVKLHATGGSIYSWSPAVFLNATNIPDPVSTTPLITIPYVVTVRDVLGCPKPVNDTIVINVIRIIANAGPRDTSVVTDQPVQLNGTGSTNYSWSPGTWLSNSSIANPVSMPENNIQYVVTVSNDIGCSDTDTIDIHYFKVKPDMFVPSAFTPNRDGNNDILKPLALGLRAVNIFRVYNRWGQLLFSTSEIGKGWNGTFKGSDQAPGTYVWYAEGIDYKYNKLERKGTAVLIR